MFSTFMNKIFHPYLDKFVLVYLDDIVVSRLYMNKSAF